MSAQRTTGMSEAERLTTDEWKRLVKTVVNSHPRAISINVRAVVEAILTDRLASRDARLAAIEVLAEKIRRESADAKSAAGVSSKPFSGESATEARVLARIERQLRAALHPDPSEESA